MGEKPKLSVVGNDRGNDAGDVDGRRRRSVRSRQRIVEALLGLIRDGEMHPSAAQVAQKAGVSLRTVFRHFEDMESLNREMGAIIEDEILADGAQTA